MTVARNGMVCCPFHRDLHPRMKLNEDYFYSRRTGGAAGQVYPRSVGHADKAEEAHDKTYKELTEENAELEKKLSSASRDSVRKKLEISQKLGELDELRRAVEMLPTEILQAAKKVIAHKPQER